MIYSKKVQDAIRFSIKTHEIYQKQKRKGKDVAYITHPLTVGIILAHACTSEDIVVAGILHDTIEDSVSTMKVSAKMITERFGKKVSMMVVELTEREDLTTWEEKKKMTLQSLTKISLDALLVKAADLISNVTELVYDFEQDGPQTFKRFGGTGEKVVEFYLSAMSIIVKRDPKSVLVFDLRDKIDKLSKVAVVKAG